jgi:predicted permease
MHTLWQDLRYGARMLWKQPGFTIVIVITLALGIGANAALFSVVNGVLLNPLPYPQPEQLVTLHASKPNFDAGSVSYLNFLDWQKENRTFAAMAVTRSSSFTLTDAGEAERVSAQLVSTDYFTVLGVAPAPGRNFAPGENETGAAPVAIISASLWQRKFGSATDVLGKGLRLDDRSYTIIGVIPADFRAPLGNPRGADVYVPIGQWNHPALRNRGVGLGIHGIGRLGPGITLAQAQADLDRVSRDLTRAYPDTNTNIGARVVSLRERMVGNLRPILWLLLGAVGCVLLIACVNVSNLLLARATGRTREFAIRAALGAGRWRLVRQLLTESLLLGALGGGLGLLLAAWGTQAALGALPTIVPRADEIGLDTRVLLFTLAVSLLTGLLSGLMPALKASPQRLSETLKEGGRGASGGRTRAQSVLVAVEMALALVLLIGAGLLIRSLNALWQVDLGFRADNVLTFGLSLPPSMRTASPETIRAVLRELSDKLNAAPGVRAASFSTGSTPLQGDSDVSFWRDGQPRPAPQEMNSALQYIVEPGYLMAMGIPLKQGRFFTAEDNERAQPVVVIDEVFARKYFPNEDPTGQRLNLSGNDAPAQIVGEVGHVNQWGIEEDDRHGLRAQIFEPFRQFGDNAMPRVAGGMNVVVRGEDAETTLFERLRRVVQSQHSQNVVYRPQTMNEIIAATLATRRFSMILLDAFALVALLLASVGLYGVISYLVGQRTQELGIRLALGAGRWDVLRLILHHGMKMALGGVALGLVAALGLTRLLAKLLYGVSPTDPLTFAAVAMLLAAVALVACWLPARRATKVDPMIALRCE